MATESLVISVSEKGAIVVKRNLQGIGKGAKQGQEGVSLLTKALAALGGALLIRQLVGIGDAFTGIQNRLRLVTRDTAELNVVTKELLKISNNTRSSLETNADLFNKLSLSTGELGVSQQELLDITKSLNQAVALSGAGTAAASAGLTQLSQGLASGALRGDEMNSVLEQIPVVADVIAKQMGITRGELRKVGSEGKVTADIVIEAFKNAGEELQEKFNKTIPTVSQSFVVLRNQLTFFIGGLDKGAGATRGLAQLILFLGNNIATLGKAAIATGIAISTILVKKGIVAATVAIKSMTIAIAANPLGALLIAVLAVVSALIAFQDDIKITENGLVNLGDTARAVWSFIADGISGVTKFFSNSFAVATGFVSKQLGGVSFTFEDLLGAAKFVVNGMIGAFVGFGNAVGFIFGELSGFIKKEFGVDIVGNLTRSIKAVVDFAGRAFTAVLNFARRVLQIIGLAAKDTSEFLSDKLGDAFDGGAATGIVAKARDFGIGVANAFIEGADQDFVGAILGSVTPALDAVGRRARKISEERLAALKLQEQAEQKARAELGKKGVRAEKPDTALADIVKNLDDQQRLLGLNNEQRVIQNELLKIEKDIKRELTGPEQELLTAKLENLVALQTQATLLEEINGPQQEVNNNMAALGQLLIKGKIDIEEFNEKFDELRMQELETRSDFGSGIELGLNRIKDTAKTFSQDVSGVLVGAFNRAADALANFATTGKLNFADLARSILSDIAKIAAQKLLLSLIPGFAQGGSFVVPGGFAHGGQFDVPGVGGTDSQTVAFNATPGETVSVTTPQQQAALEKGQGQQTIVAPPAKVQVVNVTDPSEIPDAMSSPEGEQSIMNIITRNASAIKGIIT